MLKFGHNKIGTLYLGSNKIGKAYYGSNLVYESVTGFSVTYALTNVSSSNTSAKAAGAYSTTLTAVAYYTLATVTVTMGGIDITSSTYNNGVVTIANVTDEVVITANATYNYTGWIRGRIISMGTAGTATQLFNSSFNVSNVSRVVIDGVEITPATTYTFDDVTTYHDIFILLPSTTIPNSMLYIATTTNNRYRLIELPNTITALGNSSLRGLGAGTNTRSVLICNPITPPTVGSFALNSTTYLTIYVPDESVDIYKAASGWSNQTSKIHALSEYTG